jgi:hypothetical protein
MKTGGCDAPCDPLSIAREHPPLACATDTDALSLDPKTGKPLHFSTAVAGPNRQDWTTADVVEITKLVRGAGAIKPAHVPSEKPTHYDCVVKEKMQANTVTRRVRGTAGGDRTDFPYSASSSTAFVTFFQNVV